jgi:hypothetical protein
MPLSKVHITPKLIMIAIFFIIAVIIVICFFEMRIAEIDSRMMRIK